MIALGYMYKKVARRPDWLETDYVQDIYSVSSCISEDFDDWINYWKHNGYWFFDSPDIIRGIAAEEGIRLNEMKLFFYRGYEKQWDDQDLEWIAYEPEPSFGLDVQEPAKLHVEGYDVVSYSCQTSAECSPLSCNHMAREIEVNPHCLFATFAMARKTVEANTFKDSEPGPLRIIEVCSIADT